MRRPLLLGRGRFAITMAALIVAGASSLPGASILLDLTTQDIERALIVGRAMDAERTRFHDRYLLPVHTDDVERVEVITEFRRYVLTTEERIRRGDRGFAFSSRMAEEALAPWKDRVSIVARLRFHPQNVHVAMPPVDLRLDDPSAAAARIGVLTDLILAPGPLTRQAVLGAIVEGVFDAHLVGQTRRTAIVSLEGRELARVSIDFSALE